MPIFVRICLPAINGIFNESRLHILFQQVKLRFQRVCSAFAESSHRFSFHFRLNFGSCTTPSKHQHTMQHMHTQRYTDTLLFIQIQNQHFQFIYSFASFRTSKLEPFNLVNDFQFEIERSFAWQAAARATALHVFCKSNINYELCIYLLSSLARLKRIQKTA